MNLIRFGGYLPVLVVVTGLSGAPLGNPTIVHLRLPSEPEERQALAVPTEPANTVEIDFPWPVEDWAGRGFTPDPDKFAGDFVVEAHRGNPRIFVTPVAAEAHRVLDVVLALPEGATRGVPLEFMPAPAGLAWRKLILEDAPARRDRSAAVTLSRARPAARLRASSSDSELGLIRTMRLMLDAGADGALAVAQANPALELSEFSAEPRSFGDFSITAQFAVRDATTGALGLCARVVNHTRRRLEFDPASWIIRAGDHVYPVATADFPGELEPGSSAYAFLVLARGPDGLPTRLLADNDFKLSLLLVASLNPRPVSRFGLEFLDPHE